MVRRGYPIVRGKTNLGLGRVTNPVRQAARGRWGSGRMTNTLHRFGPREDFQDDYIVFAMCTRGKNDEGAVERLRRFLSICIKHNPVNIGDAKKGGLLRPSGDLTPMVHWRRADGTTAEDVISGVSEPTTVSAVFDNQESLTACLTGSQGSGHGPVDQRGRGHRLRARLRRRCGHPATRGRVPRSGSLATGHSCRTATRCRFRRCADTA